MNVFLEFIFTLPWYYSIFVIVLLIIGIFYKNTKIKLKIVSILFLLAIFVDILSGFFLFSFLKTDMELDKQRKIVYGNVYYSNHGFIKYHFVINHKEYYKEVDMTSSSEFVSDKKGEKIKVYYLPKNPQDNYPDEYIKPWLGFIPIIIFYIGFDCIIGIILGIYWQKLKNKLLMNDM